MTTVLLTILKIIGIVLLVILGIMLFLLAVLLFVPVRYSVKGTVDNNITAEGKISWLCSIFRYDFTFQEQDLNGEVRIFGFRPKKKERVSEEELEEEAVPEVKDGVEEVVSDLVSAAGDESFLQCGEELEFHQGFAGTFRQSACRYQTCARAGKPVSGAAFRPLGKQDFTD